MSDNLMENIKNAATGHPYSPAGIQPVVSVLKADAGYNQNEATQFRECLQKCLEERKAKGAEVLHRVKHSYDTLYNRFGIQPNTVMLSSDCVSAVIAECFHEYQVINMKPDKLLGMDVMVVTGNNIVKTCIVDMEE